LGGGGEEVIEDESGNVVERLFKVCELVEYWEGVYGREYRANSGEPAYVKRVEGGGKYAMKMVGSGRGKYRQVELRQIYKDGSFNKNVAEGEGKRVRTSERMREIEQDKAEAKYGGELRERQWKLEQEEKEKDDVEQEGETRLRRQEMHARQAEKDLIAGHKRQLEEMRGDLERKRDREFMMERDATHRKGRQKSREVIRQLEKTHTDMSGAKAEKEVLEKAVKRGTAMLDTARKNGLAWQEKYAEQQDNIKDREERLTFLERTVVDKTRQQEALRRRVDDLAQQCEERDAQLQERDKLLSENGELWRQVCLRFFHLLFLSSNLLFSLLFLCKRQEQKSKKKETVNRRRQGKPCNKKA
jgi:hypothetical protein